MTREKLNRATPLVSVTALVLDTETTGLDPGKDRVVQVGAVKAVEGRFDYTDMFDELVNPGIPIPPASTEIHHITDEDVASAASFTEVLKRLDSFHDAPLIIGFSIGFDIAVMKEEYKRAGIEWKPPASLDLQFLAQIAAPQLPDRSLDTLAAWLEVPIEGRHSALGDAILTARVYEALLPKLAEKSIYTFTQAQRIANSMSAPAQAEAGWHDPRDEEAVRVRGVNEFARIDSFPYRHTIEDLMSAPPVMSKPDEKIRDTLKRMTELNISSVFVEPDKKNNEPGIFTQKDILRLLNKMGEKVLGEKVGDHATRKLVGIHRKDHLYKAISQLTSANISHLPVLDDDGSIVGAITSRNLLRQRSQDANILGNNIEEAESPAKLAAVWPELTRTARNLVFEEVDVRNIASIISRELRGLTKRACEISMEEMRAKGKGEPPVPWSMFVLGSGGRGESLLAMDQDNAIIYESGDPGGPEDKWFEEMGTRATMILHQVGVPLCKGNIMASNPEWRMNETLWRKHVQHWITRSNPQDILNSDIFFDAATVCGTPVLLDSLEKDALEAAAGSRTFIQLLSLNAANFPESLGWFGKVKTKNGRIDIKRAGLMPVFSAARVMAIKHQIALNSTPERLDAVAQKEPDHAHVCENLKESHRIFLELILKQQLADIDVGIQLSNSVSMNALSAFEKEEMQWALEQIRAIPDMLGAAVAY